MNNESASLPPAFLPVPTTKILAIGRFPVRLTTEQRKALGHQEVSDTVRMLLGWQDRSVVGTDRTGLARCSS